MITEKEYLDALKVVVQYTEQVKTQTESVLLKTIITKTPRQMSDTNTIPPEMDRRLWTLLVMNFLDVRLCDISKYDFLRSRNAGKYSWSKLCKITGKE